MKRKEPKKILKEFSWVYIFFVIIAIIFAILIAVIPSIPEAVKPYISDGVNPLMYLEVTLIVSALIDLWYYWLLRRFIDGKSNGNLYLLLLIIGVIGNLVSVFITKDKISDLNLVINVVGLYFLLKARKQ